MTRTSRRRPVVAFTLTELMIAVVVLVGVLLGVGKIFSTTSKVTSLGEATADVLQEVAAIESQLRADIASLSPDGLFAIRCVAVPNDVNLAGGGGLLNPSLAPDTPIRVDQLMFFTSRIESPKTLGTFSGEGISRGGDTASSRVYYGPAFQLGDGGGPVPEPQNLLVALDPDMTAGPYYPWLYGPVQMRQTQFEFSDAGDDDMFTPRSSFETIVPPQEARKWLFTRQAITLMDDDFGDRDKNNKTVYLGGATAGGGTITARSIFLNDPEIGLQPQVVQGRVDAAATRLDEVRRLMRYDSNGNIRPWRSSGIVDDQYTLIADELLHYPRAERYAPGMHRIDQALTNNVLGSACSSVKIDWTYEQGVGETRNTLSGFPYLGVRYDPNDNYPNGSQPGEQPWFGLSDDLFADEFKRGVFPYRDEVTWAGAESILPDMIERPQVNGRWPNNVAVYEAFFGFNRSRPGDRSLPANERRILGYTPWPTAIRVTLTVHDTRTTLENGREIQFVIDLPRRTEFRVP